MGSNDYNKITIETDRLFIRRIKKEDVKDFYDILGNDKTMNYIGKTHTKEEVKAYIYSVAEHLNDSIDGEYAIVLKEEKKTIGQFAITTTKRHKKAEISYILNSDYWNKGYAIECLKKMVDILFEKEKMNRITADCDVDNNRSISLLKKIGMKKEGVLRQERYNKRFEHSYDVVVYGLLKEEYIK